MFNKLANLSILNSTSAMLSSITLMILATNLSSSDVISTSLGSIINSFRMFSLIAVRTSSSCLILASRLATLNGFAINTSAPASYAFCSVISEESEEMKMTGIADNIWYSFILRHNSNL